MVGNGKEAVLAPRRHYGIIVVVDLSGQIRLLGDAAGRPRAPANPPWPRGPAAAPPAGSGELDVRNARWAGSSDTEIVVGGKDGALHVVSVLTGGSRPLCPCPPNFQWPTGYFEVSQDLGVTAFFCTRSRFDLRSSSGNEGVWIWRRGRKAPDQIVRNLEKPEKAELHVCVALSRDGAYVMVSKPAPTRLYKTANGKAVWEATDPQVFGTFAFDAAGKNVAMVDTASGVIYVMALADPKPRALAGPRGRRFLQLLWSSDGKELLLRTEGLGDPMKPVLIR